MRRNGCLGTFFDALDLPRVQEDAVGCVSCVFGLV